MNRFLWMVAGPMVIYKTAVSNDPLAQALAGAIFLGVVYGVAHGARAIYRRVA